MATLLGRFQLAAVVNGRGGKYVAGTKNLDDYFISKSGKQPTVESLHAAGRGVAYTKQAYAYLFRCDQKG